MLIDLEELAGEIASKVDGAGLTPVIEKEIVHYEIIRSLGRNGLLQDITFQGGTSLRLCYGSQRYSEDLDFVAGDKFDSLPLDDFSRTLRCDLLRSYDTEVSVREPKVVNDFDGVGMRRWTVSVNTNIARPDLPKQRIKLEIASVPAHTSTVRRVAVNYPELAGMYDDLTIRCQTLEEILADKLISFSATDTHIRHRDLWDIPWIVRAQEIDFSAVAALVAAKHDDYRCPVPLTRMIPSACNERTSAMPTGHSPGRCSVSYPLPFSTARTISITTATPSTLSSKGATAASPPPSASRIRSSVQGAGSQPRYRRDRFRPPACRKGILGFPKEMGVGLTSSPRFR